MPSSSSLSVASSCSKSFVAVLTNSSISRRLVKSIRWPGIACSLAVLAWNACSFALSLAVTASRSAELKGSIGTSAIRALKPRDSDTSLMAFSTPAINLVSTYRAFSAFSISLSSKARSLSSARTASAPISLAVPISFLMATISGCVDKLTSKSAAASSSCSPKSKSCLPALFSLRVSSCASNCKRRSLFKNVINAADGMYGLTRWVSVKRSSSAISFSKRATVSG